MKFGKIVLLPLIVGYLTSCSSFTNDSNGDKYLQLGETISFKGFSQTLTELNYIPLSSDDPNQIEIELMFDVSYSGNKDISFSPSFTAIFDGDENLGGYDSSHANKTPSSLASGDRCLVRAGFKCFKDWEKASITCSYAKDVSTTFEIKSSDFNYPTNNILPSLQLGGLVILDDKSAAIRLNDVRKTSVGSAGHENDDNIQILFKVVNYTDKRIYFSQFGFTFDSGFSIGHISVASNTQPTYVDAKESVGFGLILIIKNKDWVNCVVETTFNQKTTVRFNLNHNDFKY